MVSTPVQITFIICVTLIILSIIGGMNKRK